MQQASRTGIIFLVYSKSPVSLLFNYSNSVLVLSDEGSVVFEGLWEFPWFPVGSVQDAKRELYDAYFHAQPNYNAIDCIYHFVPIFLWIHLSWPSETNSWFNQSIPHSSHHPRTTSELLWFSTRTIRNQLMQPAPPPPTMSPGSPPIERNPYTKRIAEIRETVTKAKRIQGVAGRLNKCMTRNSMVLIHCLIALFLSLLLGGMFYQLPCYRAGIERRENLFHIIVSIQ